MISIDILHIQGLTCHSQCFMQIVFLCPFFFILLKNVENVLTTEGTGLVTALRILCHLACPLLSVEGSHITLNMYNTAYFFVFHYCANHLVIIIVIRSNQQNATSSAFILNSLGQQKDLKWSLAVVQLFSGEGLDTCVRVLQKLCSVLLQPWRVHGHMGPTPQRCMIISICINTLRLLRTMLTELLRGGAFQFRDTRVASVLVTLHMIVCSIPASGRLDGEEMRVQALIVDILLTFTQGVNEEVCMNFQ